MFQSIRHAALAAALAGGGSLALAPLAAGASYPTQPIKIVVPFAAGGPSDGLGRIVAQGLAEALDTTVVVENRPGAGGNIGTAYAANAAADGYTLLVGYIGSLAINPELFDELPYDPLTDLAPIAFLAGNPLVLVTRPGFQVQNLEAFQSASRAAAAGLSYGSGGVGSANHMAAVLFGKAADISAVHVPYKGAAPATMALLGDQVDFMLNGMSVALPHIQDGKLHALAVTTAERVDSMPELPTLEELGVAPFDVSAWFGFLAPAGTPADVLDVLEAATLKVLDSPEVQAQLASMGFVPRRMGQAEFGDFMRHEHALWSQVVRDSGARAD
ncbi:MAG: Bug family tripartite tricarboxylate transporter substrate binding protein [Pigmentiphaga sp.]